MKDIFFDGEGLDDNVFQAFDRRQTVITNRGGLMPENSLPSTLVTDENDK